MFSEPTSYSPAFIFGWITSLTLCSFLVGLFAQKRCNRSGLLWFFLSFVISPVFVFLVLLIIGKPNK